MLFQTFYRVDPWDFEPPLRYFKPAQFDDANKMFSLYLRWERASSEEENSQMLVQTVHRKDDVPDDVARIFSNELAVEWSFSNEEKDGFNDLPQSYRDFILSLHSDMDRMATELFNVVRWRMALVGGPLALHSDWCSMRWHDETEGENLFDKYGFLNRQIIAGAFTLHMPEMQDADFGECCRATVEELLQFQSRQPLHHDLFREAWQNQRENLRSALVMGIAAAETGLKTTIVDLNPTLTWIIENLQSPPLDRMLREYISQLPARNKINGEVPRPPKHIITLIKHGIELRNKLVHGREESLSREDTRRILEAIRDLLYLLDYYRGHDWALEKLTSNTLTCLREQS